MEIQTVLNLDSEKVVCLACEKADAWVASMDVSLVAVSVDLWGFWMAEYWEIQSGDEMAEWSVLSLVVVMARVKAGQLVVWSVACLAARSELGLVD